MLEAAFYFSKSHIGCRISGNNDVIVSLLKTVIEASQNFFDFPFDTVSCDSFSDLFGD
jgi:hypothetical protein